MKAAYLVVNWKVALNMVKLSTPVLVKSIRHND